MSVKGSLRCLALCGTLFVSNLMGMYMTPEEVEELLAQCSQPKIVHVLKEQRDEGEELLRGLLP